MALVKKPSTPKKPKPQKTTTTLDALAAKVKGGIPLTPKEVDFICDDMMSDPVKLAAHHKALEALKAEPDEVNFNARPMKVLRFHAAQARLGAYPCYPVPRDPEKPPVEYAWELVHLPLAA